MQFEFLFPGKTKETYIANGIDEYLKRLRHFVPAKIRIIKEKHRPTTKQSSKNIAVHQNILDQVQKGSYLIILDMKGKLLNSEDLAGLITKWQDEAKNHITFVVGGHLGVPAEILKKAGLVISLSPMTFTHDMARLLLIEQLYRGFTIMAGSGYHK